MRYQHEGEQRGSAPGCAEQRDRAVHERRNAVRDARHAESVRELVEVARHPSTSSHRTDCAAASAAAPRADPTEVVEVHVRITDRADHATRAADRRAARSRCAFEAAIEQPARGTCRRPRRGLDAWNSPTMNSATCFCRLGLAAHGVGLHRAPEADARGDAAHEQREQHDERGRDRRAVAARELDRRYRVLGAAASTGSSARVAADVGREFGRRGGGVWLPVRSRAA